MKGDTLQDKENLINANFKVDRELWQKFKKISKENNSDASKILRDFIIEYIKNNENLSKI